MDYTAEASVVAPYPNLLWRWELPAGLRGSHPPARFCLFLVSVALSLMFSLLTFPRRRPHPTHPRVLLRGCRVAHAREGPPGWPMQTLRSGGGWKGGRSAGGRGAGSSSSSRQTSSREAKGKGGQDRAKARAESEGQRGGKGGGGVAT